MSVKRQGMKMNKKIPLLCVITGGVLAGIMQLSEGEGKEIVTRLNRPAIGGIEENYKLNVSYDGMEGSVDILLGERRLSFEEARDIFERGREELIEILEKENGSLDAVTDDIYLPNSVLEERLELVWSSGNRRYILDNGTLDREGCKDITALGQVVVMTAKMSIQDYEAETEIPICITPEVFSEEEKKLNQILEELEQVSASSEREDNVELPAKIDGKDVEYYRFKEKSWWKCLMLGIMAALAYVLYCRQKIENDRKQREKELQLAYAPLITKFTLLISAGMTIRGAWEKLVNDYKKELNKNVAYEELQKVYNEMQNGLSEGQAYVLFGKRCKLSPYVKFGNLLEQNLRKGTKGLTERLEHEMWEAFEERKALAYRLGEEASTKLLLPMILLLGIVIAFCVIPAFLNM